MIRKTASTFILLAAVYCGPALADRIQCEDENKTINVTAWVGNSLDRNDEFNLELKSAEISVVAQYTFSGLPIEREPASGGAAWSTEGGEIAVRGLNSHHLIAIRFFGGWKNDRVVAQVESGHGGGQLLPIECRIVAGDRR